MPHAEPFCREALPCLPELRIAARRFAGSRRDLADDLVQETFVRALAAADRYRPGSNPRAWLHAILTNAARSRFRRELRDQRLRERYAIEPSVLREASAPPVRSAPLGGTSDAGTPMPAAGTEAPTALAELVSRLPPEFRLAVELVDLEGLSYKQAAARMGTPVGTVMSRLHRARRRLRAGLAERPELADG